MIAYFLNRSMDIIGLASTELPDSLRISSDDRVEEIETGATTLELEVTYRTEERLKAEDITTPGNFVLSRNDGRDELFTIIDSNEDPDNFTISMYCESTGLDLLYTELDATEEKKAKEKLITEYVTETIAGSGFVISFCDEKFKSYKLKLWFDEGTASERLQNIAENFDAEFRFTFEMDRIRVKNKCIEIHEKIGTDTKKEIRVGREASKITVKRTIENLATALKVEGQVPEGSAGYNTGKQDQNGSPLYHWVKFANTYSDKDLSDSTRPIIAMKLDQTYQVESENLGDYPYVDHWDYDKIIIVKPTPGADKQIKEKADDPDYYAWLKFADDEKGTRMRDDWRYPGQNLGYGTYFGYKFNNQASGTPGEEGYVDPTIQSGKAEDYTWDLAESEFSMLEPKNLYIVINNNGVMQETNGQYTWVKYSASPIGSNPQDSSVNCAYVGIARHKKTATKSDVSTDYAWIPMKKKLIDNVYIECEQHLHFGVPYTWSASNEKFIWFVFAEDEEGTNISLDPSGRSYFAIIPDQDSATININRLSVEKWHEINGDEMQPITLKGYVYKSESDPDSEGFFVDSKTGILKNKAYAKKWTRDPVNDPDPYLYKKFTYDTLEQKELFEEAKKYLKQIGEDVEYQYEVEMDYIPDFFRLGDYCRLVDDAGELYLSARLIKLETSATEKKRVATFGEFKRQQSGISKQMQKMADDWAKAQEALRAQYTWIVYADDANGGGISVSPIGKKYMGIAYNQTSASPNLKDPTVYTWSSIEGPRGVAGNSATAQVVDNGDGTYDLIITDETGTHRATISDGKDGKDGEKGVGVLKVTRYFKLATSKPAELSDTNPPPPPSGWSTTEPSYTEGSNNKLWYCDCTTYTNGTYLYGPVMLSSAYEAARLAYLTANDALESASGKNKNYYSSTKPTSGMQTGDLWFDINHDNAVYQYNGSSWVKKELGNAAFAGIDAGKIVTGTMSALRISGGKIRSNDGTLELDLANNRLRTGSLDLESGQTYDWSELYQSIIRGGYGSSAHGALDLSAQTDSSYDVALSSIARNTRVEAKSNFDVFTGCTFKNGVRTAESHDLKYTSGGAFTNDGYSVLDTRYGYALYGGISIPANSNLNSYTDSGSYYCASNADAATITNWPQIYSAASGTRSKRAGRLYVVRDLGTSVLYIRQEWIGYDYPGLKFVRTRRVRDYSETPYTYVWSSWECNLDIVYPIGCIYLSTSSANPWTLFHHGYWDRIANGRFLLGQGNNGDGTTYAGGSTGGAATHKTAASSTGKTVTPMSDLGMKKASDEATGWGLYNGSGKGFADRLFVTDNSLSQGHQHSIPQLTVNNMPPYEVVYTWTRQA